MRKARKEKWQEIVAFIAGHCNDGAIIQNDVCTKHGECKFLTTLNEGGYNSTSACLKCVKELIGELKI